MTDIRVVKKGSPAFPAVFDSEGYGKWFGQYRYGLIWKTLTDPCDTREEALSELRRKCSVELPKQTLNILKSGVYDIQPIG